MLLLGMYSGITNEELDNIVRIIQNCHPVVILRMLMCHLQSRV